MTRLSEQNMLLPYEISKCANLAKVHTATKNCVLFINAVLSDHEKRFQEYIQIRHRFPVLFILRRYGHFFTLFQFILLPSQFQRLSDRHSVSRKISGIGLMPANLGSSGRPLSKQKTDIYTLQFHQYGNMGFLLFYYRFLGNADYYCFLRHFLHSDHLLFRSLYHGCVGQEKEKLRHDQSVGFHSLYRNCYHYRQDDRPLFRRNNSYTDFGRVLDAGSHFR